MEVAAVAALCVLLCSLVQVVVMAMFALGLYYLMSQRQARALAEAVNFTHQMVHETLENVGQVVKAALLDPDTNEDPNED